MSKWVGDSKNHLVIYPNRVNTCNRFKSQWNNVQMNTSLKNENKEFFVSKNNGDFNVLVKESGNEIFLSQPDCQTWIMILSNEENIQKYILTDYFNNEKTEGNQHRHQIEIEISEAAFLFKQGVFCAHCEDKDTLHFHAQSAQLEYINDKLAFGYNETISF